MPTIPRITPARIEPAYDSGRGNSADAFGAGVGRASVALAGAVAGATEALIQRRQTEDAMWAEQEYNEFNTQWALREAELNRQIAGNPQAYPDSHKLVEQEFDAMHAEFINRVDSSRTLLPNIRNALGSQLGSLRGRVQIGAISVEDGRIADAATIYVRDRMDLARNEVISSPGLLQSRRLAMNTLIERNRDNLGAAAEDMLRESEQSLTYASVLGQIKQEPEATLQNLHTGEFDELLDPDDKQRAIAEGYREIDNRAREAERRAAEARRAREEAQSSRFSQLLVSNARGTLTENAIIEELARDNITSDMYRTLIRESRYEANDVGDGRLFNEIQIEILTGGPGLELISEYRNRLSTGQVSQLLEMQDQSARRGGALARDDVSRSMNFVRDVAAGAAGPLATFDTEQIFRAQQALQEFTSRLAPDGSNHRILMQEITSNPAFRAPDFGEGFDIEIANIPGFSRQDMLGEPADVYNRIRAATDALQSRRARGEIDELEYAYQVSVLHRAMTQTRARDIPTVPMAE